MKDCKTTENRTIVCSKCEYEYSINNENCSPAPYPEGTGGCTMSCHCPSCGNACCAERETYDFSPSPF